VVSTTANMFGESGDTLNLDKLREMLKDSRRYLNANDLYRPYEPFTLFGQKVVESETHEEPILRIRDDVPCNAKVRREVNDYLLKTFGTRDHSVIPKGMAYRVYDTWFIRRDDMLAIRCAV
jgi:hypothetical protein